MTAINPYKIAWKILTVAVQQKTSWGKDELKAVMDRIIIEELDKALSTEVKNNDKSPGAL